MTHSTHRGSDEQQEEQEEEEEIESTRTSNPAATRRSCIDEVARAVAARPLGMAIGKWRRRVDAAFNSNGESSMVLELRKSHPLYRTARRYPCGVRNSLTSLGGSSSGSVVRE